MPETLIITKRLHDRPDDSWTIAGANATGAYEVLRDVLRAGDPAATKAAPDWRPLPST